MRSLPAFVAARWQIRQGRHLSPPQEPRGGASRSMAQRIKASRSALLVQRLPHGTGCLQERLETATRHSPRFVGAFTSRRGSEIPAFNGGSLICLFRWTAKRHQKGWDGLSSRYCASNGDQPARMSLHAQRTRGQGLCRLTMAVRREQKGR